MRPVRGVRLRFLVGVASTRYTTVGLFVTRPMIGSVSGETRTVRLATRAAQPSDTAALAGEELQEVLISSEFGAAR